MTNKEMTEITEMNSFGEQKNLYNNNRISNGNGNRGRKRYRPRCRLTLSALALIISLGLLSAPLHADNYGKTSYPVLMIENFSSRHQALADSGIALTGDVQSMDTIPSGIATLDEKAFAFSRMGWLFETSFFTFQFAMPLGSAGVVGVQSSFFQMEDFQLVQDSDSGGQFGTGDYLIGLSYGKALMRGKLSVGASLKFAHAALLDYSSSALCIDLGSSFSLDVPSIKTSKDSLTLAVTFKNLNFVLSKFTDTGSVIIPWYFYGGFAYHLFRDERHGITLTTSAKKPGDNSLMLATGLEYRYKETIFLRGGYRWLSRETESFSFGFGLDFELTEKLAFRFDYSSTPMEGFERSESLSVSVLF